MAKARSALKERRTALGLTHAKVADAAAITREYYTMIENGVRTPGLDVAARICAVLGLDPRVAFEDVFAGSRESA